MKRMCVVGVLLAVAVPPSRAAVFDDIPGQDHWALDAVQRLTEAGILEGRADGKFHGDDPVTRYELAVALDRLRQAQSAPALTVPVDKILGLLFGSTDQPLLPRLLDRLEQARREAGPARDEVKAMLEQWIEQARKLHAEEQANASRRLDALAEQLKTEGDKLRAELQGPARERAEQLLRDLRAELDKTRESLRSEAAEPLEKLLRELVDSARKLRDDAAPKAREQLDSVLRDLMAQGRELLQSEEAAQLRADILKMIRDALMQMVAQSLMPPARAQ